MKHGLKEYFSKKTDKEIFAILLFFSCLILMTVLAVFRFCGIGYFANEYEEQELVPWVQELILFALKWIEMIFILATLSRLKMRFILLISFAYINIYWFIDDSTISFIADVIYMSILPFIVTKFDYKRITYGIILIILLSAYQFIMMTARYTIDLSEKFNYIAMIESVFDYKIFIISIYLLVYNRRIKMDKINTPDPSDERNFGGGGCMLFWGKFDKACEVIGKVVVGVCTLGIAPLAVYIYRKKKNAKAE